MGYGEESLTSQQVFQMQDAFTIRTDVSMEHYRGEDLDYTSSFVWNSLEEKDAAEYEKRIEETKKRTQQLEEQSDTLMANKELSMKAYSDMMAEKSSWLVNRTMPKKAEIDNAHKTAAEKFGLKSLSWNQRTKRGKKFANKAVLQAKMINTMKKCNFQRDVAMGMVMGSSSTAIRVLEKEGFLDNVGDEKSQEFIVPILKDISFLESQDIYRKREANTAFVDEDHTYLTSGLLDKLANQKTRNDTFAGVLEKFAELDLDQFNYKSDEEFANDIGENSFTLRYARLRAFSHCYTMLRVLDESQKDGYEIPESIAENMDMLYKKSKVLEGILLDYSNRAMLLQSPFYVLLAGKDFDELSNDDLRARIKITEDQPARIYMQLILEQRESKGFAKGMKASDLLMPGEEIPQEVIEKHLNEEYKPKTIDQEAACGYLPYLVETTGILSKEKETAMLKARILTLHRNLNRDVIDVDPKGYFEKKKKLSEAVDKNLYAEILGNQQQLENIRARVKALLDLQKNATYKQSLVFEEQIRNILTGEEYTGAVNALLSNVERMEKATIEWQKVQNRVAQERFEKIEERRKAEEAEKKAFKEARNKKWDDMKKEWEEKRLEEQRLQRKKNREELEAKGIVALRLDEFAIQWNTDSDSDSDSDSED